MTDGVLSEMSTVECVVELRFKAVLVSLALIVGSLSAQGQERPGPFHLPPEKSIWNPYQAAADNQPLKVKVLVLNYDPLVPSEKHQRLSEVFKWGAPERLAARYKSEMEFASGGYLKFEIVEWRNLNEIYAQRDGYRYTPDEYTANRRAGKGWHEGGGQDYPRVLAEQEVPALIDAGQVDEVWIFSDHFFGLWEASMAGPGAFNINGGVYPEVPSLRPFAFYGFNYERGVAEMMHDASHRTEATLNRVYGGWNLKEPKSNWDKFSANDKQSNGAAGVGTCHWPANANGDYDYGNERTVESWADDYLNYPKLTFTKKPVTRATWSRGGNNNFHLDYMSWYFAHVPRAAGVNSDGRQNNWWKYIMDFQNYTANGKPKPLGAQATARDIFVPRPGDQTFTVAYSGAIPVDVSSIDGNDLIVTGPAGYKQKARLVAVSDRENGTHRVATYVAPAPAGGWKELHRGAYRIALEPNQVRDTAGSAIEAGDVGAFQVRSAEPRELAADADTTLLVHFDGDANSSAKQAPKASDGVTFDAGVLGKGMHVGKGGFLRFPVEGAIDPLEGTVEFWMRPDWNGSEKKPRVFFVVGNNFNNGLLAMIDGANNVRLIEWGDDPATPPVELNVERGVGLSGNDWKAGEWKHLALTWKGAQHELALYLNGRLVSAATNAVTISKFSGDVLTIGADANGNAGAEATFDEFRISRRARTAAEIAADYNAALGIDALKAEVGRLDVPVTTSERVRIRGTSRSGTERDVTAAALWTSANPKVAAVDSTGLIRGEGAGTTTVTATLGTLSEKVQITVKDAGIPQARLGNAADFTVGGSEPYEFTVIYSDDEAVVQETLGFGDIRVTGPDTFQQFARLVSVDTAKEPRMLTATYRITAPGGTWWSSANGVYTVEVKGWQVGDMKQQYVPDGRLGTFKIDVKQAEPNGTKPPTTGPDESKPPRQKVRPKKAGTKT